MLSRLVLLAVCTVGLGSAQSNTRQCVCGATLQGGNVNVRSCASTDCGIVGAVAAGDCYTWLSSSGVWRRISYPGASEAWVHGDYLSGPQLCGDGSASACSARLCSSFQANDRRTCDPQGCGNFGASRSGGTRTHMGTDVKCTMDDVVHAPFNGHISRQVRPYGSGSCCDTGFEFVGTGVHANLVVWIFYAEADVHPSYPSPSYTKGQRIAEHQGLHCGCYSTTMTDHIHYEIRHNGNRIDPASWICMSPVVDSDPDLLEEDDE